jgi:hypothetical protein
MRILIFRHCLKAASFNDPRVAKIFDDGPFAADGGTQPVVPALAVFLQIAATHHIDPFAVALIHLRGALIKSEDLGVPKIKELAKDPFGFGNEDVMAAVASLETFALFLEGRADQEACNFLRGKIEKDERKAIDADRPSYPSRYPLTRNAPGRFRRRAFRNFRKSENVVELLRRSLRFRIQF